MPGPNEVIDTKQARDTNAGTILQLCVYFYLLGKVRGVRPEFMYVDTPGNDIAPLPCRIDGYATYFRLLERSIGKFIKEPGEANA